MNRGARQAPIVEVIVEEVGRFLAVHENDGAGRGHIHQQVEQGFALPLFLDVVNL